MRWRFLCMAGLLFLAGCLAPPQPVDKASPVGDLGQTLAFHASGRAASVNELAGLPPLIGSERPTGAPAFEPTIGVDPKGAVYMAARFEGTQAGERIRGSFDQGATWADVSPYIVPGLVTNPPASGDPFIYVDPVVGRVFQAHLTSFLCSWITFSDDQGKSWTTNPLACGTPPGLDDHQSIVAAPSRGTATTYGSGRLIHYCAQNEVMLHCAVSTDGGVTFGLRTLVVIKTEENEAPGRCDAAAGHVQADHAGRVFIPQVHCGKPVVAVSEDEGRTWRSHVISPTVGGSGYHMDIAADADDNLYALWIGDDARHQRPQLAVSRDHGVTWSEALDIAPPAIGASLFPMVVAGAGGRVAVGYYGSATPDAPGAPWNAYLAVLPDALAPDPLVLTTTVNPADDPVARECSGRCGGAGDFLHMVLGPDGRPWMALTDACSAACVTGTANDGGSNHAAAGTLAQGPSLLDGTALAPLPHL